MKQILIVSMDNYRKYHKGYSTTKVISTNDPRIARPFVYGMCGLFFGIGIVMLLLKVWFIAIVFITMAVFTFIKSKKDIDKIENELKAKGNYNEKLSEEEIKQYKNSVNNAWNEVTKSIFTKDKFNWFLKSTIPIYSIISGIILLIVTVFVNIMFGIIVLILLILCGIGYYYLISKIFKH